MGTNRRGQRLVEHTTGGSQDRGPPHRPVNR